MNPSPQSFHMVYVEGRGTTGIKYNNLEAAQKEAERAAAQNNGVDIYIMQPVEAVRSQQTFTHTQL
jgi:hypothetical protein